MIPSHDIKSNLNYTLILDFEDFPMVWEKVINACSATVTVKFRDCFTACVFGRVPFKELGPELMASTLEAGGATITINCTITF